MSTSIHISLITEHFVVCIVAGMVDCSRYPNHMYVSNYVAVYVKIDSVYRVALRGRELFATALSSMITCPIYRHSFVWKGASECMSVCMNDTPYQPSVFSFRRQPLRPTLNTRFAPLGASRLSSPSTHHHPAPLFTLQQSNNSTFVTQFNFTFLLLLSWDTNYSIQEPYYY